MPFRLGPPELLLLLIIVLAVFGAGRIGKIGRELGQAIRGFRAGLGAEPESDSKTKRT